MRLRSRSDVPMGINLSGGFDSATLLGLIQLTEGEESAVKAFTFVTGDPRYDELPWVKRVIESTRHPLVISLLPPADVPDLASSVQYYQDEPFGGLPTLAYARLFERARQENVIVLLDGQGLDEQWAGYDYYKEFLLDGQTSRQPVVQLVQGSHDTPVRPECLCPDFRLNARPLTYISYFSDALRNRQWLDMRHTKIPRALRFNDRISMRVSTELREPFLDHRLLELALRQPRERKITNGTHKSFLRHLVKELLPIEMANVPKRSVQTPQREWLRGELRDWTDSCIQSALSAYGDNWLNREAVRRSWQTFCAGSSDNSFYLWQWISLALMRAVLITHLMPDFL
jgi:asparagine synthase (glutamine-hydrolysing)